MNDPKGKTDTMKNRIHQKEHTALSLRPSFAGCRMSIEITNACNHRCVFCPCGHLNRERRFINESLFYRLADEGIALGIRELSFHMLGEPLLNGNLAKYIEYAKGAGYAYAYLTTNGSLATPEKIQEIFEAGLDSIKFSINAGTAGSYLKVHGKDDFEKVRENLIGCHEFRLRTGRQFNIFISCVVTHQTSPEMPRFKEIFSAYADDIVFYDIINRGGKISDEIRLPANVTGSNIHDLQDIFCQHPFNAICVTAEGFLSPCCMDGDLRFIMADLRRMSLADALYSEKMTDFRRMHMEKNLGGTYCETCLRSGSQWIKILEI